MRNWISPTVVACVIVVTLACSSVQTSVTGPADASKCTLGVTSSPSSFTSDGGSGRLNIATNRECAWAISTDASWVAISGESNGHGEASVPYSVAANPAPSVRAGAVTVGSATVQVSQAAAPCRFVLSRPGDSIGAAGGPLSVGMSVLSGCSWNASSAVGWVVTTSGQSGNGNGTVALSVAVNTGALRIGTVNVADQTYTITQSAASASPQPTPTPPAPAPAPIPPVVRPAHLEGRVTGLSGRCPTLEFRVSGTSVTTDRSTSFKKGKCNDVESGTQVSVYGVYQEQSWTIVSRRR